MFFKELKLTYSLEHDLSQFFYLENGIIKYDLVLNNYQVYDKDYNLFYDSKSNIKIINLSLEQLTKSINLSFNQITSCLKCKDNVFFHVRQDLYHLKINFTIYNENV